MRNCLLTLDYPPHHGGVARYLEALVLTFPTRFTVLSSIPGNPDVDEVTLLSTETWPKWRVAFELVKHRREDFDKLWVSHLHPLGLVAWLAKRRLHLPYVVILHGLDFQLGLRNPWKRFLSRRILRGAETIVCNTEALRKDVVTFDRNLKPVVVYPTLPDQLHFSETTKREASNNNEPCCLLTVARLVPRKNHRSVIEAVSRLNHVTYTIVGDGSERLALEKLVSSLGLHNRIKIHPDVSDEELTCRYAEADVFVLPVAPNKTDVEGFGIVYLEAAAAGLPIIATKLRGVDEALCQEGSIQLMDPTPEAIATAIQELIQDPSRRDAMGKANRLFVKSFSREEQFGKLESYV